MKSRLGRNGVTDPREQTVRNLKWALKTIKDRLREEAKVGLIDFGERLKFQYLFKLAEALSASLRTHLDDLLQSLLADLEVMVATMREAEADQEGRRQRLLSLAGRAKAVEAELRGQEGPEA